MKKMILSVIAILALAGFLYYLVTTPEAAVLHGLVSLLAIAALTGTVLYLRRGGREKRD